MDSIGLAFSELCCCLGLLLSNSSFPPSSLLQVSDLPHCSKVLSSYSYSLSLNLPQAFSPINLLQIWPLPCIGFLGNFDSVRTCCVPCKTIYIWIFKPNITGYHGFIIFLMIINIVRHVSNLFHVDFYALCFWWIWFFPFICLRLGNCTFYLHLFHFMFPVVHQIHV